MKHILLDALCDLLEFAAICLIILPLAIVAAIFFSFLGEIIGLFF
jgi:hypothetical protein